MTEKTSRLLKKIAAGILLPIALFASVRAYSEIINPPQTSTVQRIDDDWVNGFISLVNSVRNTKGLQPLREENYLDSIAQNRFDTAVTHPFISHYGVEEFAKTFTEKYHRPLGEEILAPDGSTEQDYLDFLKQKAPSHWNLLMAPKLSTFGYYIHEGPTVDIKNQKSCHSSDIPGPNINIKKFLSEKGCDTFVENSDWLVIDMSDR